MPVGESPPNPPSSPKPPSNPNPPPKASSDLPFFVFLALPAFFSDGWLGSSKPNPPPKSVQPSPPSNPPLPPLRAGTGAARPPSSVSKATGASSWGNDQGNSCFFRRKLASCMRTKNSPLVSASSWSWSDSCQICCCSADGSLDLASTQSASCLEILPALLFILPHNCSYFPLSFGVNPHPRGFRAPSDNGGVAGGVKIGLVRPCTGSPGIGGVMTRSGPGIALLGTGLAIWLIAGVGGTVGAPPGRSKIGIFPGGTRSSSSDACPPCCT
mmetsp:Transcript_20688/g.46019  ORF Transcript_20688/g.46019 Transcript_20688/m.46019 type:complete len:270 (-) Transcript_20688:355-1164(-)